MLGPRIPTRSATYGVSMGSTSMSRSTRRGRIEVTHGDTPARAVLEVRAHLATDAVAPTDQVMPDLATARATAARCTPCSLDARHSRTPSFDPGIVTG